MITCDYCGRSNEPTVRACRECGTELAAAVQRLAPPPRPEFSIVDPAVVETAALMEHGFRHVDWSPVARWIEARVDPLDVSRAWGEVAVQWLTMLRDDLGGGYFLLTTPDVTVLCDQPPVVAEWILGYSRGTAASIREVLGDAAD